MKRILTILPVIMLILAGCASSGESAGTEAEADAVTSATPAGTGWMVTLKGVREDSVWESQFNQWLETDGIYVEREFEKKDEIHLYGGISLKDIIAMVDDPSGGMPYIFQEDLWKEGYDVTFTAADGYSATFSTAETDPAEVMIAVSVDGEKTNPQAVGNISSRAWVRDLSEISISLAPVSLENNSFELLLDINGKTAGFTISEMENMPIYVEDKGSFTNSYGNTTSGVYGGIKLIPLLSEYMEVTPESTIKIIAMDGYEMDYGGDMLLDQDDGDWILAFKENGEYMPEDPGYIRLMKVGPGEPNITGHISARMIKKIATEAVPFRDFNLTIEEKDAVEVFDRQTLQSGVVTNKNKVVYYDKKSDTDIIYKGISIWRLLERLKGYKAVTFEAEDGYSITLSNSELEGNDDVILAMYTGAEDELLSDRDWPLKLVWDKEAEIVPEGIKSVRNVIKIILVY